jgi:hypothetical protein
MQRLLMVMVLVVAACSGSSSGDQSAAVCTAIKGLNGNHDDFQTMLTASQAKDAFAAIDRMSERARTTVAALKAVNGAQIAAEASQLAAVEEGLLPILAQFRATTDQAGWAAATAAYTSWYNQSLIVIEGVASRLDGLGVHCA